MVPTNDDKFIDLESFFGEFFLELEKDIPKNW